MESKEKISPETITVLMKLLKPVVIPLLDELMKERGYVPKNNVTGKTIGIKEFAQKYCKPHGINWVKEEIFYKFKPDWVVDLHPGQGRSFTIFEHPAAIWMEEHRKEINWK